MKNDINEVCDDLKEFLLNLADPKVINFLFSSSLCIITNNNNYIFFSICNLYIVQVREYINSELSRSTYKDFISYYMGNDKLGRYTISTELSRMQFTAILDGRTITKKEQIECIFEDLPEHGFWKLANQSIYTEILTVLQRTFVNPELSINIISNASSFQLDFDTNILLAESKFYFITVQDPRYRPSKGAPSDRLELACITGSVQVSYMIDDCHKYQF